MSQSSNLVGGVLIGGKSRRMGATKALLRWGDGTMLEHVAALVGAVCDECVLLGKTESVPATLGCTTTLPDAHPGAGPIAGLQSLLKHHPDGWSLLVGCDLPLLRVETLQTLIAHPRGDASVVAFRVNDRLETCCALYHSRLREAVSGAISEGDFRLQHLVRCTQHVAINPDVDTARSLLNVNTPDDYDRLTRPT